MTSLLKSYEDLLDLNLSELFKNGNFESSIKIMMNRSNIKIAENFVDSLASRIKFKGNIISPKEFLTIFLIAEPKAIVAFAGRRVIQSTVRENLPDEFQTAEYVKDHGGIDLVVERKFLSSTIGTLLSVLLKSAEQTSEAGNANVVQVDKSLQSVS